MAIRFEPSCDDNGQWHVGAAGNLYLDRGQSNRQLSINSPLDLRYHEASDYDDRRTSSCSPDSCDLSTLEKMHGHSGPVVYDRSFLHSPHNEGFRESHRYVSPDRRTKQVCHSDLLSSGRFHCVQRSKTISDFDDSHRKRMEIHPSKTSLERKLSVSECVVPRIGDTRIVDEIEFSKFSTARIQNGGMKQFYDIFENAKRDHKRFETSGYVDSDLKIAVTSAVVKNPVLKKGMKNGQQLHFTAGFGETDAAEALLGLSEGFYQTMQSQTGVSSHSNVKQYPTSDSIVDKAFNTRRATTMNAQSDTKTVPTTAVQKEGTVGRKHFKKLFCQKFVNSVQPSPAKVLENSSSTKESPTSKILRKEMLDDRTISNSIVNSAGKAVTKDVASSEILSCEQNSLSSLSGKTENCSSLISQNNNKLYQKSSQFPERMKEVAVTEPKQQVPKTPLKNNENSSKGLESIKKKEISNLYRISKSLGSSNESMAESVEEDNADVSESSSDSSNDDSENDDDEHCSIVNQDKLVENESSWCSDYSKRKTFVLSKPTFSVSAWDKSIQPLNDKFPSSANKTSENNRTTQISHKPANGSETKALPISNKSRISFQSSESTEELAKQSSVHIKKATFTFSGAGKLDKTTQQSGLGVTSPAVALLDGAQCAVKDRNSFPFDRDKLDSSEAAKAKQAASQNDSLSTDRVTFGTFRNGDSFENLSKPTLVGTDFPNSNREQVHDASKEKSLNLDNLPYDKHRLPRPSARSAELEAQQKHVNSKTGRKRKLSIVRDNGKENSKSLEKPTMKRSRHAAESSKKSKSRLQNKHVSQTKSDEEKVCDAEQNGEQSVETNKLSAPLSLERSSSRRKPTRVYKHQKYTSVSMMSSSNSPRDSSEFTIISKPLNLDHRVLLANSIDLYRGSSDNLSIDSNVSSPMTSSSCSSTTSSVASDDNDVDPINKSDSTQGDKSKDRLKRHRHLSAIETNTKPDFLRRKHKMKRLLSMNEQVSRKNSVRLMTSNVLANSNWHRSLPRKGETSTFRLLSLFPAPASLRPVYAHCELLPGYGPSVSGQRSSLPLRWTKGSDESDLKKKRQHQRWRNMTLDMFCMGAKF